MLRERGDEIDPVEVVLGSATEGAVVLVDAKTRSASENPGDAWALISFQMTRMCGHVLATKKLAGGYSREPAMGQSPRPIASDGCVRSEA